MSSANAISPQALADSLNAAMDWPTCVPSIRVKNINQRKGILTIRTDKVLSGKAMDKEEVEELKAQIARWVCGQDNYRKSGIRQVQVYTDGYELSDLTVDHHARKAVLKKSGPTERGTIVLWASHGRYHHEDSKTGESRDVWQRAKMWQTVEDRLTTEFTTRLTTLLENAGYRVLMPRPDPRPEYEQRQAMEIGQTGVERWQEGAVYWLRDLALPTTITDYTKGESEYKNDLFCRPLWVNHLIEKEHTPVDMVLAVHTDGYDEPGDSAMVGTLAMYSDRDDNGKSTFADGRKRHHISRQLAHNIQRQIVSDMRASGIAQWPERRLRNCQYVECRVPKVPSMILEIASHKDISDAIYLLDPNYQQAIARAIYKGIVRSSEGEKAVIAPLPPHNLHMRGDTLCWSETTDTLETSARAAYYIVTDRYGREYRTEDTHTRVDTSNPSGNTYHVRAYNDGGRSDRSRLLSVAPATDKGEVLIINAFSRVSGPTWYMDSLRAGIEAGAYGIADGYNYALVGRQTEYRRDRKWVSDDDNGWGECSTEWQERVTVGNTHDYHLKHAQQWQKMGYGYRAIYYNANENDNDNDNDNEKRITNNEKLTIDPSYRCVDVILGEQEQIDPMLRKALEDYYHAGGHIIVSGAWVGQGVNITLSHWNRIRTAAADLNIATEPNPNTLYCNKVRALRKAKGEQVYGYWRENGLPAIICGNRYMIVGAMMESIDNWQQLLEYEEKKLTPTGGH